MLAFVFLAAFCDCFVCCFCCFFSFQDDQLLEQRGLANTTVVHRSHIGRASGLVVNDGGIESMASTEKFS